jgi:hypothetical protein
MERLVIALVLIAVVAVVALVLQRRRPDPPTQRQFAVPTQLDRNDFVRPEAPWLVTVFTSATCGTCADVATKVALLDSDVVATQDVEVTSEPTLHTRYGIDAVPTTVVADADGVVQRSWLGPITATDLWAAVAELREPGTLPPGGCQSHSSDA